MLKSTYFGIIVVCFFIIGVVLGDSWISPEDFVVSLKKEKKKKKNIELILCLIFV